MARRQAVVRADFVGRRRRCRLVDRGFGYVRQGAGGAWRRCGRLLIGRMKLPRDKSLVARNPGFQVPFAAKIRKEAHVATMAVGLILEPQQAEAILQSGEADLIALAREMLANPNFAAQAALELEGASGWDLWSDQFRYWLERRARTLKRERRA